MFKRLVITLFIVAAFLMNLPITCPAQEISKTLVVFYSRDGHTKKVAQRLSEKFNADLEELIDQTKRTGPIAFMRAGKDAVAGNLTELKSLQCDPQDYDIILIGTPGWWSNVTPAVRTYIDANDISDKHVGVFGTAHLTGIENAIAQTVELIFQKPREDIPTLGLYHSDLKDDVLPGKIDDFYQQFLSSENR